MQRNMLAKQRASNSSSSGGWLLEEERRGRHPPLQEEEKQRRIRRARWVRQTNHVNTSKFGDNMHTAPAAAAPSSRRRTRSSWRRR